MRKAFFLAAVLVACAKVETPPSDTASAMAPAPPRNLTAADIAGSWNGTSMMAGSDSVTSKWVVTSTSDSTGTLTYEGSKTPIAFTSVMDADSTIATSVPFVQPGGKANAPKVMFRSVGRMQDGKLVGTSELMLAAKHDSIVAKRTFVATKAP